MKISLIPALAAVACLILSGCAQSAVGTDPANGVTYKDKGVEANVAADTAHVSQVSRSVLERLGYQTSVTQSQESNSTQSVEARNGIQSATVKISPNESGHSHVEVIAKTGDLCSNMDYAGQVLQDIVLSK